MRFQFRFDKKYNPTIIEDNYLKLVSRDGLTVVVEGSFYDALQLQNYPFVKELHELHDY